MSAENTIYKIVSSRRISKFNERIENPRDDYVRIQFQYCGLCGSDLSRYLGYYNLKYPFSIGHEFVAKVCSLGDNVSDLSVGDIVTSDIIWRCGQCYYCKTNRSHVCVLTHKREYTNLGFSKYANFHKKFLRKIDGNKPLPKYSLAEPLSCAIHAVSKVDFININEILIIGCGGIGSCIGFYLSHLFPQIAIHLTDIISDRMYKLRKCIGDHCQPLAEVNNHYDLIFDTSGTLEGLKIATNSISSGGTLISMSHVDNRGSTDFVWNQLVRKDATFSIPYLNGNYSNFILAIKLLNDIWNKEWDNLLRISPVSTLDDVFKKRNTSQFNKEIIDLNNI